MNQRFLSAVMSGTMAAATTLVVSFPALGSTKNPRSPPPSAHCAASRIGQDSFCTVAGLRLHYVDWGGSGSTLILLAGLGDSARIFDDFAPLLALGHRVIAITRRGYGASSAPGDGSYSNAALVGDTLGLMDALSIPRASFIGHSIAGGELATLGADHAERVDRLIYIDASYDRTLVPELMAHVPPLPAPDATVRHDLDSLTRWREATLGVQLPAVRDNLGQTMLPGPDGLVPRTAQSVNSAVLGGDIASKPRWDSIAAPSLAFFTSKDVSDQVPPEATTAQRAAFLDYSVKMLRPWMLRAQADFVERTRCGVAIEVPRSTHYLFLERSTWTAKTILEFLASEDPCRYTSNE
jgi:pimeloyl-ACP methyl ester carboxylesterase